MNESNKLLEINFSYSSPLSAGEQLSVQQPPHHPAGDLDVDAQQAKAIVVMSQLVPDPLVQGPFGDCPLLQRRNRADRGGSGGGGGRRLRLRRGARRVHFHLCARRCWRDFSVLVLLLLEPGSGVMHAAGEEGGVVTSVTADKAIAGVPDGNGDGGVAGRCYVE